MRRADRRGPPHTFLSYLWPKPPPERPPPPGLELNPPEDGRLLECPPKPPEEGRLPEEGLLPEEDGRPLKEDGLLEEGLLLGLGRLQEPDPKGSMSTL